MNKNSFLVLALALASCSAEDGSESGGTEDFKFSYEIDTVQVDSKGVLFFLNDGLMGSGLSPDYNKLYTYNEAVSRLDIVDLEKLEFTDSLPLDKEGPNGIGDMGIGSINVTDSGDYYFSVFRGIKHFDAAGNLKSEINWITDEKILNQLENGALEFFNDRISADGATYYGLYTASNIPDRPQEDGLAIMDLASKNLKMIDIPALKALNEFTIRLVENGGTAIAGDQSYLKVIGSKILISNGAVNGVSVYDLKLDSLMDYRYATDLLPAEKPGNYPRKVGTMEEFRSAMGEKRKEPLYGEFHFDSTTGYYYRVSFLKKSKPDGKLESKGVLSIFDENLNLIYEEAGDYSGIKFIRDGKIYRFINIEDEMGFVRIKPTFE
jgi:hypothetical protein